MGILMQYHKFHEHIQDGWRWPSSVLWNANIFVLNESIWTKFGIEMEYDRIEACVPKTRNNNLATWPNMQNSVIAKIHHCGGRHIEFGKTSISSHWIKIFPPNLVRGCINAVRRWSRDQKSEPVVNSRDVASLMFRTWWSILEEIPDTWTKHGTALKHQTTVKAKRAKFT